MNKTTLTPEPASWRVLIIDDKPLNLKLAQAILEPAGAEVILTQEPQAVLSGAVSGFNLILLDLAMPDISGLEVHQQLRARREIDHIPIIAFTAMAMEDDISRGMAAGLDGYITKPFRVTEMLDDLRRYVEEFLARGV